MAAAVPADVKAGAVVSMVVMRAAELGDALPAASVAMAVMALLPSLSAAVTGTVWLQLPALPVVVLLRDEPSATSSTELWASAVPVKLGVVSAVRLSELELPLSELGVRSGVEGAAGAVVSTVIVRAGEESELGISDNRRSSWNGSAKDTTPDCS